jgi:glycogen debranching enzyme
VPQETISIRRERVVGEALLERIRIMNYNSTAVELRLELAFFADFADMFEVRGLRRLKRGKLFKPKIDGQALTLAYLGEDQVFRQTRIDMSDAPDSHKFELNRMFIEYNVKLPPRGKTVLSFDIQPIVGERKRERPEFHRTVSSLRRSYHEWENSSTRIVSSNELFNSIIERGQKDIRALMTRGPHGSIITAGIPWYAAPFGRDGLIAALQVLPLNHRPARDTLDILAHFQAKEQSAWHDSAPGKIMHEFRYGELAALGEIPHSPYYGSVDSTPLFLVVMSEYYQWTGDVAFVRKHRGAIKAALEWIDRYGDMDGDGLIEYRRQSTRGLINQGWKDSHDAIAHADGTLAAGPIALVEVQAYVYYAKKRMSRVFRDLGEQDTADRLAAEAGRLKKLFNERFWLEEERYYALALDGDKKPVRTITSNPGQALWTGVVDDRKAGAVIKRLLSPEMFSGWGIRTVAKKAAIYNPMSYHNGSIWPHDNALIVRGLKRYGRLKEVESVAAGLFGAAAQDPYFRLPELFCGFTRRGGNRPVEYPVACSPQAWAAGTFFMILQSILGLTPDAPSNLLYVNNPTLPPWLDSVSLSNLQIGAGRLTIAFNRVDGVTGFTAPQKEGKLRIVMEE